MDPTSAPGQGSHTLPNATRPLLSRWLHPATLLALATLLLIWRGFLPDHTLLPLDIYSELGVWKHDPDLRQPPANHSLADVVVQFVPWDTEIRRHLAAGEIPWTDRFAGGGVPLFANPQTALFSPFTWPRLLWGERGWAFCVFLRLWISGLGVFYLARTMGAERSAATLSGFIFLASGYGLGWAMHPLASVTACLPWMAAGVLQVSRHPTPRNMALTILAAAGATAGGHPESLAMAVVAIAVLLLWHTAAKSRRNLLWCAAAAAAGFLLLAVVTVPFLYLVAESEASVGRFKESTADFRAAAFFAQILPGYLGGPLADEIDLSRLVSQDVVYQMRNASFLGAIPLLGLIWVGSKLPLLFRRGLMIGGVALVLSWCPPLIESVVSKLPLFDMTWPTYRAVGFVVFGAAAAGPALFLLSQRARPRLAATLVILGAGLLVLGLAPSSESTRPLVQLVAEKGLEAMHQRDLLPNPPEIYEERLMTYLDLAAATARRRIAWPGAAWLLAGLALAGQGHRSRGLLTAAVAVELLSFGVGYLPALPADSGLAEPETLSMIRTLDPEHQFQLIAGLGVLPPNIATQLGLRDLRSYVVIENAERMEDLRAMGYSPSAQQSFPPNLEPRQLNALAAAGTRFFLSREEVPGTQKLAGGPPPAVGLYEIPGAQPTPLPPNQPPAGLAIGAAISLAAGLFSFFLIARAGALPATAASPAPHPISTESFTDQETPR